MGTDLTQLNAKAQKILKECSDSGEPVFVIRAKDIFSNFVLREYEKLVQEYAPDDHHFVDEIEMLRIQFKDWQRDHTEELHFPD